MNEKKLKILSLLDELSQEVSADLAVKIKQVQHLVKFECARTDLDLQRFEYILEGAGLGAWDWRITDNHLTLDKRWCELLGLDPSEPPPDLKSWSERVHPDDMAKAWAAVQNHLQGKTPNYVCVYRLKHKLGHWVWVLDQGRVSGYGPKGEPARLSGTIFDITAWKESEIEKSTVFDFMSVGLVVQDLSGAIVSLNPAAHKILGTTGEQLVGKPGLPSDWSFLREDRTPFPMDERPSVVALRTGQPMTDVTVGVVLPNGVERWLQITSVPFDSVNGWKVASTFTDVTNQIQSNAEIKYLFSNSPDLMCISGLDGTFKKVSPSFTKVLGWSEKDLLSQPFANFIHPEDREATAREMIKLAAGKAIFDFENRYLTKSGNYVNISWVCESVPSTGLAYATGRDVTAKRTMAKERKLMQQQLVDAQSIAKIGSWQYDLRTGHQTWSSEHYRIFEIPEPQPHDQLYQLYRQKIHRDDIETLDRIMYEAIQSGKDFVFNHRVVLDDGKRVKYVRGIGRVTRDAEGQPVSVSGTCQDLTEQHRLEAELEAERAKAIQSSKLASLGEMSAGVAHEINNPLAIIIGNLILLTRDRANSEKFDSRLEIVKKAARRIEKIVSGLRKFSRSSEGPLHHLVPMAEILSDVLVITEAKSKRFSTPLTMTCPQSFDLLCDGVEIEQVLVNLINNAIDAVHEMEDRWVHVEVTTENGQAVIRVTDSGKGIPSSVEQRLFEPFFTTKRVGQGTGLGLSISKGIVESHKGVLFINKASPNTCFEIRLPLREGENRAC